jgi:hypothetical protein
MGTTIHVEAARIPDRDRLVRELEASGLEARPVDEVGIEVPYADGAEAEVSDDVFSQVQDTIMSIGAPFVPIKHEGVIYIRPPVG